MANPQFNVCGTLLPMRTFGQWPPPPYALRQGLVCESNHLGRLVRPCCDRTSKIGFSKHSDMFCASMYRGNCFNQKQKNVLLCDGL